MTEHQWEAFANKDPYWYVAAPFNGDMNEFWKSGKSAADTIYFDIKEYLSEYDTVIDIGCGVGRCIIPMCSHFKNCVGVDVSETMLRYLDKHSKEYEVSNQIQSIISADSWFEIKANFIYSVKSLPYCDQNTIKDYVEKIGQSLLDGGLAYLHFDTRTKTLAYKIREYLPNFLLPRHMHKGIRRMRNDAKTLIQLFERNGLTLLEEKYANTELHVFILRKTCSTR